MIDRRTGNTVREEQLRHNCALVKYLPQDVPILDLRVPEEGPAGAANELSPPPSLAC